MRALLVPAALVLAQAAPASWKAEFDEICGQTDSAMEFSVDELRSLLLRCEKLKPVIQKLPAQERKFYSGRLESCRKLYAFVLETHEKEK